MSDLKGLARELRSTSDLLRRAADALDNVFELPGTPDVARQIEGTLVDGRTRLMAKELLAYDAATELNDHAEVVNGKARTWKMPSGNDHWTRRPENRTKLLAMAKRSWHTRRARLRQAKRRYAAERTSR